MELGGSARVRDEEIGTLACKEVYCASSPCHGVSAPLQGESHLVKEPKVRGRACVE